MLLQAPHQENEKKHERENQKNKETPGFLWQRSEQIATDGKCSFAL